MVKITNGVVICEVTKGAFDSIYSKNGYKLLQEDKKPLNSHFELNNDTSNIVVNNTTATNADIVAGTQEQQSEEKFIELIAKPIEEWTKEEIKSFAEAYNIDISNAKNIKEAREIIKQNI